MAFPVVPDVAPLDSQVVHRRRFLRFPLQLLLQPRKADVWTVLELQAGGAKRVGLNVDGEFAHLMERVDDVKVIDSRAGRNDKTDILNVHAQRVLPSRPYAWVRVILPAPGPQPTNTRAFEWIGAGVPCPRTSSFLRNSRTSFRRRILARRIRPNLALSPFRSDMATSLMGSTRELKRRPNWPGPTPPRV